MALRFFVRLDPATAHVTATLGPCEMDPRTPAPVSYCEVDPAKAEALLARTATYNDATKTTTPIVTRPVETQLDRIEAKLDLLLKR